MDWGLDIKQHSGDKDMNFKRLKDAIIRVIYIVFPVPLALFVIAFIILEMGSQIDSFVLDKPSPEYYNTMKIIVMSLGGVVLIFGIIYLRLNEILLYVLDVQKELNLSIIQRQNDFKYKIEELSQQKKSLNSFPDVIPKPQLKPVSTTRIIPVRR